MPGYDRITFLTDYGLTDGFVAACHGVVAGIAPHVRITDVTHLVPRGDVRRGAALLAQTLPYFPPAVHLAVVDPGVGTSRRALVVRAGGHLLVGPDNGLLAWAAEALAAGDPAGWEAREVAGNALTPATVSRTFHGRDVFAPVAARLAAGVPFPEVGPRVPDPVTPLPPVARVESDGALTGEVLTVDSFGNVQTSLKAGMWAAWGDVDVLRIGTPGGTHRVPLRGTFGDVAPGEPVAFPDSAGLLALAVRDGDAARRFALAPGDGLRITR